MRPNVVIVVADDLGPDTIAPTSPLPLPNLRALHDASLVFKNARASAALCAPGRYALMTGNLPLRSRTGAGEWGWPAPSALKPGQRSIAQLLREGGGYHTQFAGKWHLGGDPIRTGFDGALFAPRGHSFSPYTTLARGTGIRRPAECAGHEGDAHLRSNATIRWRAALPDCLAAHARNVLLNAPTPFLYYHAASQKHGPVEAGVGLHQLETVANASDFGPRFDAVVSFDLTMGVILRALDARGVVDSTVVVLTSDHGQDCEWEHVVANRPVCPPAFAADRTRSVDFFEGVRGYKGSLHEGGLRVPLWVRWPGHVHPRVSTATTGTVDYVRTLLRMLRVGVPPSQAMDSADLSDEWLGASSPPARTGRNVLVANTPVEVAIRIGDQKAFFQFQNRLCWWGQAVPFTEKCFGALSLYDLSADPMERDNRLLVSSSAGEARCMFQALLRTVNSASPPRFFDECAH